MLLKAKAVTVEIAKNGSAREKGCIEAATSWLSKASAIVGVARSQRIPVAVAPSVLSSRALQ